MVEGVLVNYGCIAYSIQTRCDCSTAGGSRLLLLLLSIANGSNSSVVAAVGCNMPAEQDWRSGVHALQAGIWVSTHPHRCWAKVSGAEGCCWPDRKRGLHSS
jgi:hypothetical protein